MIKSALCIAGMALLASSAEAATTVSVTFTDTDVGFYSGSFVATDTNGDGLIERDEVDSFTTALGASSLTYFGDYDIADNLWSTTTAGDWYYLATAGSHTLGVTSGDDVVTTITQVSTVPEPASSAMLALGLLAAFAGSTRKIRRG